MNMEIVMNIEGMMCPHCEAAVKKALEAIPTVESAEASHEKGEAVVKLSAETPFDTLKSAVEALDYKVTGQK
ncbi:MAG: cation transporter [Ruminiclostridium sp.]|nr:cation transporter [Ruminiclostridium sp.]